MELVLGLAAAGIAGISALLQAKLVPSEKDFQNALNTLVSTPDDPAANLIVGKYKVFVQGDYTFGIPHLAKSSDKTLQTLAQHELDPKNTDTPEKKVGMGDEWVIAAKKFPALSRAFYDRASDWYVEAWPKLTDLWKAKLREQGKKLALSRPPGAARKVFPTGWVQSTGSLMDQTIARTGSYSAKLPEIDPKTPATELLFYSDPITVTGKKFVEVSAYGMSDLNEGPIDGIFVYIFDKTATGVGTWLTMIPPDLPFWRRYTVRKEIPEHIVFIKVGALKRSKKGTVWADDFTVKLDDVEVMKNGSFEEK